MRDRICFDRKLVIFCEDIWHIFVLRFISAEIVPIRGCNCGSFPPFPAQTGWEWAREGSLEKFSCNLTSLSKLFPFSGTIVRMQGLGARRLFIELLSENGLFWSISFGTCKILGECFQIPALQTAFGAVESSIFKYEYLQLYNGWKLSVRKCRRKSGVYFFQC